MRKTPTRASQVLDIRRAIQKALLDQQQGKLNESALLCEAVLKVQPSHATALHLLGVIRSQQGKAEEASKLISRAVQESPNSADLRSDLGIMLQAQGLHEEAVACYDKALQLKPDHAAAHYNRGISLSKLNRDEEAAASYDKALTLQPGDFSTLYNRGNALARLGRHEHAVASFDSAIALRANHVDALHHRGLSLAALGLHKAAVADFDAALALSPAHAELLRGRGDSLRALQRYEAAISSYDQCLSIQPEDVFALFGRGRTLSLLNSHQDAIANYRQALAIKPDTVVILNNLGNALRRLNRHEEAIASYDRALVLDPNYTYAFDAATHSRAYICDWTNHEALHQQLVREVRAGKPVTPFGFVIASSSPTDQQLCAASYVRHRHPPVAPPLWAGERYRHDRIRLAYLSADLQEHATAYLMAGLFEQHDRQRFETIAVSFSPDGEGAMRTRIRGAFDRFIDAQRRHDAEIAKLLRDLEIDIAVDLKGFTTDSRTGIFAHRPVPVQVNYLGYPGTMGTEYIDYILADRIVIPEEHQPYYTEKVVYLPDSYQVNDSARVVSELTPSRADAGLPEQGFVFCCFNSNYKITPDIFDVWMNILRQVEGSVLWLLAGNASVAANLRREAAGRGIAPERLVFSRLARQPEHLARHRLADLFLDTLPCNAHTTASDALWAGLPVLTCLGTTFAGRVAASLLTAVGLPELITYSLRDYEQLAIRLATDPALHRNLKSRLDRNRSSASLFDTDRFRRHIEAAYTTMWQTSQRGEPPKSFAVRAIEA